MLKIKRTNLIAVILLALLVTSCKKNYPMPPMPVQIAVDPRAEAKVVPLQDPNMIRTSEGANSLDLENPLRCNVNWETQNMITTLPYNLKAFNLTTNGINQPLPRFEVTGFSFDTMPAEKALLRLTKGAGIKLVAKDGPYTSISAENLRGGIQEVIEMITSAAEIYYSYDANTKTLTLSRKANFTLYVPKSQPIILALLDVIRGAGITNITTDWADYSITFDGDYELREKIENLLSYFENNPTLITYDVSVFTIHPHDPKTSTRWQDLVEIFDFGTIRTAKTGVIGRVLTTSNDLNVSELEKFISKKAAVVKRSEGKFVVPNLWLSRFDVGKCMKTRIPEAQISLLAKSSLMPQNRIFSDITIEGTNGQITQFNIRSKLGENFLIIGIPNEIFGTEHKKSETVIFMVPRIIRTIKKQPSSSN